MSLSIKEYLDQEGIDPNAIPYNYVFAIMRAGTNYFKLVESEDLTYDDFNNTVLCHRPYLVDDGSSNIFIYVYACEIQIMEWEKPINLSQKEEEEFKDTYFDERSADEPDDEMER